MAEVDFFKRLESQFKQKLPFVGYRKPNDSHLRGMLLGSSELYRSSKFSESGFVFAPFDGNKPNVLFPLELSEKISALNMNGTYTGQKIRLVGHQNASEDLKAKHISLVEKGLMAIGDNQFKKVVLSRVKQVAITNSDPIAIFTDLLILYPNAFVYVWYHPKVGLWCGATPETLVTVKGLRFKTMALAGTQPYLGTETMKWDKKNLTEQKLVVNFIEEELEAVVDTFMVSQPQTIKAGNLLHIKSDISGVLKSDVKNLEHLISSLHPTPAVCGLPKEEAKEFILKNEDYDREFYTGFLGELNIISTKSRNTNKRNVENSAYASVARETNLYVNLRCMQLKDSQAFIYVGGGVTKASVPKQEWEETVSKAKTMLEVFRN